MYCSIALKLAVQLLRPILDDIQASVSNMEETVSDLESTVSNLASRQDDIDAKLDSLDTKQDELNMQMMSVGSELEHNVSSEVKKTYDLLYEHVYPDTYTCGGEEGWRHVVYLDMTDNNTDCPGEWQLIDSPKRTCGRFDTYGYDDCDSAFFPVTGGEYTRVCGTIRAYQFGATSAFEEYHKGRATTIDATYVDGVSLTHGSPRQHIWTFAVGLEEERSNRVDVCPCDTTVNITIPPFVGEDYFCESGRNSTYQLWSNDEDPLWDGEGCASTSTCCEFNNPPYFTKQLSNPTTDDIEARLCHWYAYENTLVEFVELYVK